MNKKTIIVLISIIIAIVFISLALIMGYNKKSELDENSRNIVEISAIYENEPVTDECLNEWEEYSEYVNEKIEEASSNIIEDDTHYLIKDVLGYIEVYYLDENKDEYLYKKTNIPTKYLSQEDIDDLEVGIEVTGIENLNKALEDFE